ncbi:Hypothetical protein HDN1F_25500 [gamma proteobacterium HdN1]|nr:Hypothetical protein HDN1F_25500 [gamma proteobacterium HdN1]
MKILESSLLFSAAASSRTMTATLRGATLSAPQMTNAATSGRGGGAESGMFFNQSLQAGSSSNTLAQSQWAPAGALAAPTGASKEAGRVLAGITTQVSQQQQINLFSSVAGQMTSAGQAGATYSRSGAVSAYQMRDEQQMVSYQIAGSLRLDDGRQLDFSINGSMSRYFRLEEASGSYASNAQRKDPLVVNFGGGSVNLTEKSFAFDLAGDGQKQEVSFATGGSGFLFLDKNNNGSLDDGTELFGVKSGDGFADLAKYDEDGNGFIDENDSVFKQLRVVSRDEKGKDSVYDLSSLGVEAIGLQSVATPMALNSTMQHSLGELRATGVGVHASGAVFTVQQVDLTLRDEFQERRFELSFEAQVSQGQAAQSGASQSVALQNRPQGGLPEVSIPEDIEDALQRLREMTSELNARYQSHAEPADEGKGYKSLLQQLLERLEKYVQETREDRKEKQNSTSMA